eukprot:gene18454-5929_t
MLQGQCEWIGLGVSAAYVFVVALLAKYAESQYNDIKINPGKMD